LFYTHFENCSLLGYIDNDYAGRLDDQKNTVGYSFHLGTNMISWTSKKQSIFSICFVEAEYVATSLATCQAMWLRTLLKDISNVQKGSTPIYYDKI